jgi:hypothetical protein
MNARIIGGLAVTVAATAALTSGVVIAATRDDDPTTIDRIEEVLDDDTTYRSDDELADASIDELWAWWWDAPGGSAEESRIEDELTERGEW